MNKELLLARVEMQVLVPVVNIHGPAESLASVAKPLRLQVSPLQNGMNIFNTVSLTKRNFHHISDSNHVKNCKFKHLN